MSVPGRTLGLTASIIAIVLPIVAVAGAVSLFFSVISTITTGFTTGSSVSAFTFSIGLIVFFLAIIIMGLVEFIFFVVSIYQLSQYYNEPDIFRNLLYAILVAVISIVIAVILEVVFVFASIAAQLATPFTPAPFFAGTYLVIIAISLGLSIVSGFFVMRMFNKLKDRSGKDSFGTAGILYIIGMIVPVVGWVAWIFAAIGFNNLKPSTAQTYFHPTISTQTIRCPNCGAENPADAIYCGSCGKPLQ
jgi:uncharacterized membrane protein